MFQLVILNSTLNEHCDQASPLEAAEFLGLKSQPVWALPYKMYKNTYNTVTVFEICKNKVL